MPARRYELSDASVVVVIGSGAGGGVLANELAQKGIDVVCLEAGLRFQLADFVNDEPMMFRKFTWLDPRQGTGDLSPSFPIFVCKTVGGTTVHWTGLALRMTAAELQPLTTYGPQDGARLIDWPVAYAELARYYDKAERKMGVAGTHGLPRQPGNNNFLVLKAGAERLGYKNIATANLAINSVAYDARPKCLQIGFCKSGCGIGAKWSTLYTEIPKAEATGYFELRPESMVLRIEHDHAGRVSGVVYADAEGVIHEQKARAICVAGNAIETPRLLLNSASNRFPDGIGNSHGNVGRYYMRHVFSRLLALMPGKVNMYRGIQQAGSLAQEAHHDPRRGFASGYHIETAPVTPEHLAKSLTARAWSPDDAGLMAQYEYFAGAITCGEDFPSPDNRVTLHAERRDRYGLPIPVIHYASSANSRAMRRHAVSQVTAIYEAIGARRVFDLPMPSATHNMGTCRMAVKETEGVCDQWGRVFGVPNLFISDGSQFTSAGTANPTLTIVALAIRQADRIADQLAKSNLS